MPTVERQMLAGRGMVLVDSPGMAVVNAPSWWMSTSRRKFLRNAQQTVATCPCQLYCWPRRKRNCGNEDVLRLLQLLPEKRIVCYGGNESAFRVFHACWFRSFELCAPMTTCGPWGGMVRLGEARKVHVKRVSGDWNVPAGWFPA